MMLQNCRRRTAFSCISKVCDGSWKLKKGHCLPSSTRTRAISTGDRIMQQPRGTSDLPIFLRFLKEFLRNTPNQYPKSYFLKEFGWNDFNKIGDIHPHSHVNNMQLAAYLLHSPWLDDSTDISFVGRSLTLNFLPIYHDTNFISRSVKYDSYVAFLGRTSMYNAIELRDAESDVLYISALQQNMAIDVNQGAPVPVAAVVTKHYADKSTLKTPPQRLQFMPLQPDKGDVFRWKTTVQWSDVDYNGHVNQTPYIRYMYDAGSSAAVEGSLKSFKRELIHYKLKTYSVEYMREIRHGKVVDIICWEMDDKPGTINFQLLVGDRTVSRSHLTFYDIE